MEGQGAHRTEPYHQIYLKVYGNLGFSDYSDPDRTKMVTMVACKHGDINILLIS